MAEDAEDLSIHAFKALGGPAERSLRRAPRPRGAPRPPRRSVAIAGAVAVLRASAHLRVKFQRTVVA